uniref:Exocyst complex component Sec8 n=1 Tax=Glossina palpalis gambiensis TaxID=67801 RepID=A0A1B0ATU3_9MUSC
METKHLMQDLPCFSEELLKAVCCLLKDYREICQAAYRSIVQPDTEDKRIYSVAWLKDENISRFLKTLSNWTALKSSSHRLRQGKKLQRHNLEASEEESSLQVQQRNIREAEMLTSNLGEGGISQQEILTDICVLKEIAILQISMQISGFANELRCPLVNGLSAVPDCGAYVAVKDGTLKVLTNLALEFDELANVCLLVLHLEIGVELNCTVTVSRLIRTLQAIRDAIKKLEAGSSHTTSYAWYAEELGYELATKTMKRLLAREKAAREDSRLAKGKFSGVEEGEKVLSPSTVDAVLFGLRRTVRELQFETVFEVSSTATAPSTTG